MRANDVIADARRIVAEENMLKRPPDAASLLWHREPWRSTIAKPPPLFCEFPKPPPTRLKLEHIVGRDVKSKVYAAVQSRALPAPASVPPQSARGVEPRKALPVDAHPHPQTARKVPEAPIANKAAQSRRPPKGNKASFATEQAPATSDQSARPQPPADPVTPSGSRRSAVAFPYFFEPHLKDAPHTSSIAVGSLAAPGSSPPGPPTARTTPRAGTETIRKADGASTGTTTASRSSLRHSASLGPTAARRDSMFMAHADRRRVRQYIGTHRNELSAADVRARLKALLFADFDGDAVAARNRRVVKFWNAVAGGPIDVMRRWLDVSEGSPALHDEVLSRNRVAGTAVMSDSAGLSKLSQQRPMLEVLRLVHEPKEIVYNNGVAFGKGVPVPAWVADNTAMFYPNVVGRAAADGPLSVLALLELLFKMQQRIDATCTVKIGMCAHTSRHYYNFGGKLLGHEAERVEVIAEDDTSGGEVALTEETLAAVLASASPPQVLRDGAGRSSSSVFDVGHPLFVIERRDEATDDNSASGGADAVDATAKRPTYRLVPRNVVAGASLGEPEMLPPAAALLVGPPSCTLDDSDDAGATPAPRQPLPPSYPSSFSDDFFDLLRRHSAETIVAAAHVADHLLFEGIFILVKIRNVHRELLLDSLAQSLLACEIVADEVEETAALFDDDDDDDEGNADRGADGSSSTHFIELIKCNGNVAIARATSAEIAISFCRGVSEGLATAGFGSSVGAWHGVAYIFDLAPVSVSVDEAGAEVATIAERDCAGQPINLASKLAEDFATEGIFFGDDIVLPADVAVEPVTVSVSGVEITAKKIL